MDAVIYPMGALTILAIVQLTIGVPDFREKHCVDECKINILEIKEGFDF